MPSESGYYRHATIHGDSIAFVCEDDLWTVPVTGGLARRLTTSPGMVSFPAYSPDGRQLAFTGRDDGPAEVYVMDAEGGPLRRLTWLGSMTQVVGWSPDGAELLFASDWRQPFRGYMHLHALPAAGGEPRALRHGPARAIARQPDGPGVVIGRNSGDPARWKRYRGGTAGTLWVDRRGDGSFAPLVPLKGNLASPMWLGPRIYFLSDHEGFANLYSSTPTGRDLRRHTHHEDFFARFPSTDGRRIAYQAGADLHVFDSADGTTRKVDVRLRSSRSERGRKFVSAGRHLEGFDLHPAGHSIACVSRGGAFSMPLWEGAPRRQGAPSKSRFRLLKWLPDGKRAVAVSDEGGEEGLVVFPAGAGEAPRRLPGDFARPIDLAVAPAGPDRVALANQRQEVLLVDLASGQARVIEKSEWGRIEGLAWSPDGRWLAYGFANSRRTSSIHLCDAATGQVVPVTRPDFRDVRPSFDPEGKYLYFISWRVFDPIYDSQQFALGFPKGALAMLLPLRRDLVSPFSAAMRAPRAPGVSADDEKDKEKEKEKDKEKSPGAASPAVAGEQEAAKDVGPKGGASDAPKEASKDATKEPPKVDVDFDGILDRSVTFPLPEGRYSDVRGGRGRAFILSFPVEGSLDQSWIPQSDAPGKGRLEAYDFELAKADTVHEKVSDFALSLDAKVLAVRSGGRVRVVPATFKPDGKPASSEEAGRESGWLALDRLRVAVETEEEWRQMFVEAWRLQRDQFWTPDMSGVDWAAVRARYLPLVERVSTRAEFSDLLWEMQGELGTSHCYELGGDYRPQPAWHQGFLGADLEPDTRAGAWRIGRIPRGDSWDEDRSSPLAAPGLCLRDGDELLEVEGEKVGPEASPYERLVDCAGREVHLTVRSRGAKAEKKNADEPRAVVVKALKEEYALRYRDWVEGNRARVHEETGGRVGYLHVPDMGPAGYSEFHRYFPTEVDREGLIVDVRWNGGGHVSQLLLEKLARRRVGYCAQRWARPESYPSDAPMGPMVALTNEYAGSDGDIFSHSFKLYKLGPLIGKRTWGGVVGIWPRHALVDGTWTTQPEFAFWFQDVGWGVENYGTDPDIEVENRPQDHAAGRDRQLERGLVEILRLLRKARPRVPELKGRPKLRPGRLPKG
ncbi:MAG: PDZ domain-containing protein [Planctomycetes bacterium]|nr:PDZ domain-containing protein [Planctomycetota bacterium]